METPPLPAPSRPQTPAKDAIAHDAAALIGLLLSSLSPPERHHLLTASRALGWDLEKIGDPVRGPIGRLSESAAARLIEAAFDASHVIGFGAAGLLWPPSGRDLPDALAELREKVLR